MQSFRFANTITGPLLKPSWKRARITYILGFQPRRFERFTPLQDPLRMRENINGLILSLRDPGTLVVTALGLRRLKIESILSCLLNPTKFGQPLNFALHYAYFQARSAKDFVTFGVRNFFKKNERERQSFGKSANIVLLEREQYNQAD
jgi:hypothetical protein